MSTPITSAPMASLSLALLIFGYLAAGFALLGLACWGLIAVVPDMRGKQPEAFHALGRLCGHGLAIGVIAIALAHFARWLATP